MRAWVLAAALLVAGCGGGEDASTTATSSGSSSSSASSTSSGGDAGPAAKPYDLTPFDAARIGSDGSKPNFQKIEADIDLHDGPFSAVTASVDLASTCFPFSGWKNDAPPTGQNWPADCDAFDRNFELSLDDPPDGGGPPGLEVMRAITPFGGPEHVDVDLTDVANGIAPGKHALRVLIPTYSDAAGMVSGSNGGWNVTVKIHAVPGAAPRNVLAVIPLWDGEQTVTASPAPIAFQVPSGTKTTRIEYRVTGHGGATGDADCIGPAEEFCKRTHVVSVDGKALATIEPWRTDCATLCTIAHYDGANGGFDYCEQNPCGDPDSVRASRANWCPGSLTPPLTWDAPALHEAGKHTFSWTINEVATGGEWRLSAVFFAFGD